MPCAPPVTMATRPSSDAVSGPIVIELRSLSAGRDTRPAAVRSLGELPSVAASSSSHTPLDTPAALEAALAFGDGIHIAPQSDVDLGHLYRMAMVELAGEPDRSHRSLHGECRARRNL